MITYTLSRFTAPKTHPVPDSHHNIICLCESPKRRALIILLLYPPLCVCAYDIMIFRGTDTSGYGSTCPFIGPRKIPTAMYRYHLQMNNINIDRSRLAGEWVVRAVVAVPKIKP